MVCLVLVVTCIGTLLMGKCYKLTTFMDIEKISTNIWLIWGYLLDPETFCISKLMIVLFGGWLITHMYTVYTNPIRR